jgi:hypothetical protein
MILIVYRYISVPIFEVSIVPISRKLLKTIYVKNHFTLLRRQMLYPPELRERNKINDLAKPQPLFRKIF